MKRRDPLFWPEALLLVTVATPLVVAEQAWWYGAAVAAGVAAAYVSMRKRSRPLLGPTAGKVFVLFAFVVLMLEYIWIDRIPTVLALSHFMILVCVGKLMQERSLRDDAQVLVLELLLLVVAAIVSGSLLFPAVLAVFLTLGLHTVVRCHMLIEADRTAQRNRRLVSDPLHTPLHEPGAVPAPRGVVLGSAVTGLMIGAGVFLLFPRVGGGMLGQFDSSGAGQAVTGLTDRLDMRSFGPILESDRPVMRVLIEDEAGNPIKSTEPLYLRSSVLDQYVRQGSHPRSRWAWRRGNRSESLWRRFNLESPAGTEESVRLLDASGTGGTGPQIVQHYYVEPTEHRYLFSCYPPLSIASREFSEVRKCVIDQVLQLDEKMQRLTKYTVRSPVRTAPSVAEALAAERPPAHAPQVLRPTPPLDREADILNLVNRIAAPYEPLNDPERRLDFVHALEHHLRSGEFGYTLDPPPIPAGTEPIGHFLLETKRGHCEYFASALAVMCQLKGIPARVVSGYRTGDYNSVGDFYVIRNSDAHAWVEAYVPDHDWVTLDGTAPGMGPRRSGNRAWLHVRRYLDYLQFRWSDLVLSYDDDMRQATLESFEEWLRRPTRDQRSVIGAVAAFVKELFGWRLQLTWSERLIYWAFTLLVLALVALTTYVVVVFVKWLISVLGQLYPTIPGRRRQVDFYRRFCQRLEALGLSRPRGQTPAEFAHELAEQSELFHEAPELVRAYYEVAFGGRDLPPERAERIEAFLRRLTRTDRRRIEPVTSAQS